MKNILIVLVLAVVALGGYFLLTSDQKSDIPETSTIVPAVTETEEELIGIDVSIDPISHATMALEWGGVVVYTDPVGGAEAFDGVKLPDIILITDIHSDHLNVETLEAVIGDETVLVVPRAVADLLTKDLLAQTIAIANGETTIQNGFSIEAIPMYNLPESDDSRHTKGRGNGYVVERDGVRVYIAGDTADIPEMRSLAGIDIAFVPMNLPFTMTVESAADAVLDFAPRQVYPYHYRGQDGLSDIGKFKEIVNAGNPDIDVVQLVWYPDLEVADETGSEADVVINVSGKNFEFSVEEIRVKEGDIVTINFESESGLHNWTVDEFRVSTERVRDGGKTSVTFVADKAGIYEYYCSVGNHREQGMVGTLIVK